MPVWDLLASARLFVRGLFIVGIIMYLYGLVSILSDTILGFWNFFIFIFDKLVNSVNGNGDGSMSCTFAMMHALGIDIVLTSLLTSVIGILVMWASTIISFLMYSFAYKIKIIVLRAMA